MIVPDLNLLLYAYQPSSPFHRAARAWWEGLLSGSEAVGLPWIVILGFMRISTNPRIFDPVSPVATAIYTIESWFEARPIQILQAGPRHAEILFQLVREAGAAGNLTTDAHIAALAIENNAVVNTADPDFLRFSGCRWINPLEK